MGDGRIRNWKKYWQSNVRINGRAWGSHDTHKSIILYSRDGSEQNYDLKQYFRGIYFKDRKTEKYAMDYHHYGYCIINQHINNHSNKSNQKRFWWRNTVFKWILSLQCNCKSFEAHSRYLFILSVWQTVQIFPLSKKGQTS